MLGPPGRRQRLVRALRELRPDVVHAHNLWPQYGFDGHKGYPTPDHLAALREHGVCDAHRRSYAPVRAVLEAKAPGQGAA